VQKTLAAQVMLDPARFEQVSSRQFLTECFAKRQGFKLQCAGVNEERRPWALPSVAGSTC
jgi:hypothetical protein